MGAGAVSACWLFVAAGIAAIAVRSEAGGLIGSLAHEIRHPSATAIRRRKCVLDRLVGVPPGKEIGPTDVARRDVETQQVVVFGRRCGPDVRGFEGKIRQQLVCFGVVHGAHQFINSGISVSRARRMAIARRVRDFTVPMGRPSRAAICDCERSSS